MSSTTGIKNSPLRFSLRDRMHTFFSSDEDWWSRLAVRGIPRSRHVRVCLNRRYRFNGESFERAFANTGLLAGNHLSFVLGGFSSIVLGGLSGNQLTVAEVCEQRFRRILDAARQLPDSYNKTLIQGSAEYCLEVMKRLSGNDAEQRQVLLEIRNFATQEQGLLRQFVDRDSSTFSLLDLQMIEDRFLNIQDQAGRLGVLARLNEIPIEQLFDR
jgi:hypothetical protein